MNGSCADFAAARCNREISAFVNAALDTKGGKCDFAAPANAFC